jgi:hypothetical protein
VPRFRAGYRLVWNIPGEPLVGFIFCWIHFPDTGPTVASNWAQLKRQEENQSWEDGADESDDMVVWASHACKSLMAAAIADDRRSDIKS